MPALMTNMDAMAAFEVAASSHDLQKRPDSPMLSLFSLDHRTGQHVAYTRHDHVDPINQPDCTPGLLISYPSIIRLRPLPSIIPIS